MKYNNLVNPYDFEKDKQEWLDHLTTGLYDTIYGSINENAKTSDPFNHPSFGEAEMFVVNQLLLTAASVFLQHGIEDVHGNLSRYINNLEQDFIEMLELRNNG